MLEGRLYYHNNDGNIRNEVKVEGIFRIVKNGHFLYFNFNQGKFEDETFYNPGDFGISVTSFGKEIDMEYNF